MLDGKKPYLGMPNNTWTARSAAGFLLVDPLFKPQFMNSEAFAILSYPDGYGSKQAVQKRLSAKIKLLFPSQTGFTDASLISTRLQSGRRSYLCSMFFVSPVSGNGGQPLKGILLERNPQPLDFQCMVEGYSLTKREQEVVQFLIQGLTTKEIAMRMGISPHTVKTFLKLVMVKVNVTTRSGIVGKFLQYSLI